jgi:hypothetical protein
MLASIFTLGFSLHAQADSIYSQVRTHFAQGAPAIPADVNGAFTGRCYSAVNPDIASGELLIGFTTFVGADNGPLFPPRSVFKVVRAPGRGEKPDAFDTLTPEISERIKEIKERNPDITEVIYQNGSLVSSSLKSGLSWHVRKNGNNLFTESNSLADGSNYSACYFFKKISN